MGSEILRRLEREGFSAVLTATLEQLHVSRIHELGWKHRIELAVGFEATFRWFIDQRLKS